MVMNIMSSRSRRSFVGEWWRSVDQMTLSLLICLLGAGLILSMAASPAASARLDYDNSFFFLYRHLIFVALGLGGAFAVSLFDTLNARRLACVALLSAIVVMLSLPFIGNEVKGAVRWIRVGPLSLQPSEFAKPAFIVFAAWMFSIKKREPNVPAIPIVFGVYLALIMMLITQPDFGQSFLLTLSFAAAVSYTHLTLPTICSV